MLPRHPALLATLLLAPLSLDAAFDPALSPFVEKPAISYSSYTAEDGSPGRLVWGEAPFEDFGSRSVVFDPTGLREVPPAPAAGVHPRIFFGPDQLPDVRRRVLETRSGREAWKNILAWTEMMKGTYDDTRDYAQPDRFKGGFSGLRGRVPLFRLNAPRTPGQHAYNRSAAAAALYESLVAGTATTVPDYYWNVFALEAFRALIEDDAPAARRLAAAVTTALKLGQAKREADPKIAKNPPVQPVGGFQLAFCYDFLFASLTPGQRTAFHAELAASTWAHDNYGTFNTAEGSRSNWATFSYWLYQVLAIEGEEGFNDLKVRGMYRGWRNLLTYGWFQSGATYEGEGKNQLGMDGILLFSARSRLYGFENLAAHPYLQAYARSFLPHSANAMLRGFHKYDLLGGSRAGKGGFAPMDVLGLKFLFPNDRVIDWVYRESIGENYEGVPDRPDGYFNALLFYAIYATDHDAGPNDPASLGLGHTFFCGERALMMTRSAWHPEASQLNMHTRQANGGHPFSDRNAIMFAGAGRIWSPNGYANYRTQENSVVGIDGLSQNEIVPARCVDFVDTPAATFMVGDAKYAWDWTWRRLDKARGFYTAADAEAGSIDIPPGWEPVTHSVNDFAFTKLPHAYLDWPIFQAAHWLKPKGAISPYVRKPLLPVRHAFRSAGLVRPAGSAASPYAVVLDDIQAGDSARRYDWTLLLERDIQIVSTVRSADGSLNILLAGDDPAQTAPAPKEPLPALRPEGEIPKDLPLLWVKFFAAPDESFAEPAIVEELNLASPKKYPRVRRLVVSRTAPSANFRVLLHAYRQGAPRPEIAWDARSGLARVTHAGVTDQLRFLPPGPDGKTDLVITRAEGSARPAELIRVERDIAPLPDPLADQRAAELRRRESIARGELRHWRPADLPGLAAHWDFSAAPTPSGLPAANDATLLLPTPLGRPDPASGLRGALACSGESVTLPLPLSSAENPAFTLAFWLKAPAKPSGTFVNNGGHRGLTLSIERESFLRMDADSTHRWAMLPVDFQHWVHVAATWDGAEFRLYLDGEERKRAGFASTVRFAPATTLGTGFTGSIDELALWRRALSPEEIARLHLVQAHRDSWR